MDSFSSPCDLVVKALRNVQSALGGVMAPTGKVDTGRMKYRHLELDVILAAALPLLEENALTLLHTQSVDGTDCYLIHESGQWLRSHACVGVDDSMTAQEVGSAASYGRRYSIVALLGIAAGDDDGAAATEARKNAKAGKKGKAKDAGYEEDPKDTVRPQRELDIAIPWDDAEREAKFYATLEASKVPLTYPELVAICAEAGRPPPHKMDDGQLERFTKFIVREHGSKAA